MVATASIMDNVIPFLPNPLGTVVGVCFSHAVRRQWHSMRRLETSVLTKIFSLTLTLVWISGEGPDLCLFNSTVRCVYSPKKSYDGPFQLAPNSNFSLTLGVIIQAVEPHTG